MRFRSFLLLSIFFLSISTFARAASDPGEIYMRLIEGDVQMQAEDSSEWVPAAANTPLLEGDKLWVPEDGKAEIRFRDGVSLRLGASTAFEMGATEDGNHEVYLDEGVLYGNSTASGTSGLVVYLPDTTLRIDTGTIFNVLVRENGEAEVSVLTGMAYATTGSRELRIDPGSRLIIGNQGNYRVFSALPPEDEWVRWNRRRDREAYGAPQTSSTQYLPEELGTYASDLERNGRWLYEPEYGYVWTPTVVVASDWSPYRVGRWVWIRGDYVWVSYEPWGWAPYHYGRWVHVRRAGWCWVPPTRGAAYWAPAYVGWVNTPTHVSWVPLAPRETYYGRGYFGPHSVNIMREKTDTRRPSYRNIHVNNAVTTVNITTFLSGRPSQSRIKDNLFLKHRPSLGAPSVAPVRTSMMPAVKEIPRGKEPPERFRNVRRATGQGRGMRKATGQEPGSVGQGRPTPPRPSPAVPQRPQPHTAQPGPDGQRDGIGRGLDPAQSGPENDRRTPIPSTTNRPAPTLVPGRNATSGSIDRNEEQRRFRQEKGRADADRQKIEAGGTGSPGTRTQGARANETQTEDRGSIGTDKAREQPIRSIPQPNIADDAGRRGLPGSRGRSSLSGAAGLARPDTNRPTVRPPDGIPSKQAAPPTVVEQRSGYVPPGNRGEANRSTIEGGDRANTKNQNRGKPEEEASGMARQKRVEPNRRPQRDQAVTTPPPPTRAANQAERQIQQEPGRDFQRGRGIRQEHREGAGGDAKNRQNRELIQGSGNRQGERREPRRIGGEQPDRQAIAR